MTSLLTHLFFIEAHRCRSQAPTALCWVLRTVSCFHWCSAQSEQPASCQLLASLYQPNNRDRPMQRPPASSSRKEEIPCPRSINDAQSLNIHSAKYNPQLLHRGDIQIPLGSRDHFLGPNHLDAGCRASSSRLLTIHCALLIAQNNRLQHAPGKPYFRE